MTYITNIKLLLLAFWVIVAVGFIIFFYCAEKLDRRSEMTPEEIELIAKKQILKARIRNMQRWGGGNTTTGRIKELKEELKGLEEGEDANT